ncbi:MAG: hypothetical protein ACOYMS_07155 [Terrimicrobiaceae bacterium]
MKSPIFNSLFSLAILATSGVSFAQTAATVPVGAVNITIAAGSASVPKVSTFSIPLRDSVPENFVGQASGRITGVTATSISNANAGWTAGALSQAATPYFLRITSGSATGRTLQIATGTANANTATTLSVLNQGTDLTTVGIATGTNGDTYEIFPGDTLGNFFGNTTLGGTSASVSDVVRIHDGSTWSEYYYNTTAGQWRIGSVPVNQNNVVLRPDGGITFYRRGTTPLEYTLLGVVPSTPVRVVVKNGGVTYLGNVFPVDQTLGASGFNSLPGWVNNTGSVGAADKTVIWDGSTFNYYNYNQTASQWRAGSVPVNQSNVVIPAGRPVIVERPAANSGVSTLVRNLPYNLN